MYSHRSHASYASLQSIIEQLREEANRPPKIIVGHTNPPENGRSVNRANEAEIASIIEQIKLQKPSVSPVRGEPIPFALDLDIDLLKMPLDLEASEQHPPKSQASLCSVVVLNGINDCVMSLPMSRLLHLDYAANKEPIQDIGISSNSWHVTKPSGGYRLLQSVLLRRTVDKTAIAVVNPVMAPFMEFDFVLGTDYLASIGIDWPKDVKKMRPLEFKSHSFFSSDSDFWPVDVICHNSMREMSPSLVRRERECG